MQKPSLTFAHRRLSWDQIPQISKFLAQSYNAVPNMTQYRQML